jgi:hypothetical protein
LASPASWLRATDPARTHHVTITDEDVHRPRAFDAREGGELGKRGIQSATDAGAVPDWRERVDRAALLRHQKHADDDEHQLGRDSARQRARRAISQQEQQLGGRSSLPKLVPPVAGTPPSCENLLRFVLRGAPPASLDAATPGGGSSPGHLSRGGWGSGRRKLTPTNTLEPQSPRTSKSSERVRGSGPKWSVAIAARAC